MIDTVPCPHCRRLLQLPEGMLGQIVQCPSCQTRFEARAAGPAKVSARDDAASTFAAAAPTSALAEGQPQPASESPDAASHAPGLPGHARRSTSRHPLRLPASVGRRERSPAKTVSLILLVIVGVWVLLRVVMGVADMRGHPWQGLVEDDEERRRAIIEAFQKQAPLAEGEMSKEIAPLFERVRDAFKARKDIVVHLGLDRLFDEVEDQGILPPELVRSRRDFVRGMQIGMEQALKQQAELDIWTAFEIRSLKKLQGNEAVVFVRHRGADGIITKMRWWVSKRSGQWKVYDFEDLDIGMRVTALVGSAVQGGVRNVQDRATAMKNVGEAMMALAQRQDVDTAERKLEAAAGVDLPKPFEGLRHSVQGLVHMARNRVEQALASWEQAHRLHPDMPALDLFKGMAHNQLARWEDALKHIKAYEDLLGDDANVCREKGRALFGLNRDAEAAAAFGKSLDYNGADMEAFLGLLDTRQPDPKELAARLRKSGNARATFDLCADDCVQVRNGVMLERLALAMREIEPDYRSAGYYAALAKAWRQDFKTALAEFQGLAAKEKDDALREHFTAKFIDAARDSGKAELVYAALPDAKQAFRLVASELQKVFAMDELRGVVAAHRKKHPGDPLLSVYEAQLHVDEEEFALADEAFTKAAKLVDAPTLDLVRGARVTARYRTGRALEALKEIEPRRDTFNQLAHLCLADKKLDVLETLLDAYAKLEREDPEAARFRMRLAIRRGKIDDGIALFKKIVADQTEEQQRLLTESDFVAEMIEADKALLAYRSLPDSGRALEQVVGQLRDRRAPAALEEIIVLHRKNHPRDPDGALQQGELYIDERKWSQAADAFAKAIELAGGGSFMRDRVEPRLVYARYEAGEALKAYEQAEKRKETFQQLAALLANDKRTADLEKLIEAHRRHAPGDPELLFYESLAALAAGRVEPGARLFQEAHAKQTLPYRKDAYVRQFVLHMRDAGQGIAGYRLVPDKHAAFQALANDLLAAERRPDNKQKDSKTPQEPPARKELEALLEQHGREHRHTTAWLEFAGELALLRGDAAQAEKHFQAALEKDERGDSYVARRGLERALVQGGKTVAHYRADGGRLTYTHLANACLDEKNATELAALLAERRKAHPNDRDLLMWDTELKALRKDHEGVLQALTQHRDKLVDNPRHNWRMEGLLVRTLIALKRFKEAVQEAEKFAEKGDRLLPVLSHAASGDVPAAIAALEKVARRDRYVIEDCYRDPDLGPILRSKSFAPLRERFPEPKTSRPGTFRDFPD